MHSSQHADKKQELHYACGCNGDGHSSSKPGHGLANDQHKGSLYLVGGAPGDAAKQEHTALYDGAVQAVRLGQRHDPW